MPARGMTLLATDQDRREIAADLYGGYGFLTGRPHCAECAVMAAGDIVTRIAEFNARHAEEMRAMPSRRRRTLRAIAIFEAVKGVLALAGAIGLLSLLHHDLRHVALEVIGWFKLNPAGQHPMMLLHYADVLNQTNPYALIGLAAGYVSIRLAEAYGLWFDLAWAEWLGALSGALYLPFEIHHLLVHPHWSSVLILLGNLLVVAYLGVQLWRRRQVHHAMAGSQT